MLDHGTIKIDIEDVENDYNEKQQIQDRHKVIMEYEDILKMEDKSVIGKDQRAKLKSVHTSKIPNPENVKTNRYSSEITKINKKSENEIHCINVPIQHNNSACRKVSTTVASANADTKVCGNIWAFCHQKKLIFNCLYCDLKYGDLLNFKRHLQEYHKMFHLQKDIAQENAPRSLRKSTRIPKEKVTAVALPLSVNGEWSDCCGNVCISLKEQKLFLICGLCEYKFSIAHLFEKHLRQEHHIFKRSRIKSETSTETIEIRESYELDKEAKNILELIESNKGTVREPKAMKRYPSKRQCTLKSKQEDSKRTKNKSQLDVGPTTSQKASTKKTCTPTLIFKIERRSVRKLMQKNAPGQPFPVAISYKDQSKQGDNIQEDQSHYKKQIPKNSTEHNLRHFKDKKYKCTSCELSYVNSKELKLHMRHHSTERRYKCSKCPKRFVHNYDLNLHVHTHSTERRYICPHCPKGFVRNSDLKIHLRIHTGEKPFVCDICQRCFRAKQNLTAHRKLHMGEAFKTYECQYCDKKFIRKIDRKIHIRSHTKEKPYKCEICDRAYTSKFNLLAHQKRNHTNSLRIPKVKSHPKRGSESKPLTKELTRQKKLIEKLQNQLLEQIETDERILPTDDEITLQESAKTTHTTSQDQLKNAFELLNQITSTVIPLLNI